MLGWALAFLIIALILGILGFSGAVTGTFVWMAQVLFVVFLVLFLISAITGAIRRPPA